MLIYTRTFHPTQYCVVGISICRVAVALAAMHMTSTTAPRHEKRPRAPGLPLVRALPAQPGLHRALPTVASGRGGAGAAPGPLIVGRRFARRRALVSCRVVHAAEGRAQPTRTSAVERRHCNDSQGCIHSVSRQVFALRAACCSIPWSRIEVLLDAPMRQGCNPRRVTNRVAKPAWPRECA